ncbi:TetR family transcriptional regulator [Streptomyces sp. NPDC005496]|uniref:TetR family transcriptional regulator n=1 Tax=unclassified Streptomyces TaxID=2593676 RepID=UPI0033B11114
MGTKGTARERILDAAEELITSGQVPPALDAVAAAAGVSKGGLLYHFDKQALLSALVTRAVRRFDERLTAAAADGLMAAAWLRLSVPSPSERTLYRAMVSMLRLTTTGELDLPGEVADAEQRWQDMLTAELGDPVQARTVRLVGDGLFMAALTGRPATADEVEELLRHLGVRGAPADGERP